MICLTGGVFVKNTVGILTEAFLLVLSMIRNLFRFDRAQIFSIKLWRFSCSSSRCAYSFVSEFNFFNFVLQFRIILELTSYSNRLKC